MIPEGFLPFGSAFGDSALRGVNDGSTGGIQVGTDVIIFGTRNNLLFVSIFKLISLQGTMAKHTSAIAMV